jgi:quaternary ammonium compound-resistance protein SugE
MSNGLAWCLLIVSGLLDVAWAVSMKFSDGYTRPAWSLASLAALAAFVWLLGRALQVLPLGNAYAVWTGVGAVGSVLMGVWLFGEAITMARLGFIALIAVGIVGLKLTSS